MSPRFHSKPWPLLTGLAAIAGLLYCSWPLGYWLNPVANRGLASNLEALNQPFNWLFIGLDIISGALLCIVAIWLLRHVPTRKKLLLRMAIIGLGVFGLLTAVDAVLPLDCVSTGTVHCAPFYEDPYYILHGVASIGLIAGLTLSIVCMWWLLARDQRSGLFLRWLLYLTILVWFGFGIGTACLLLLDRSSALSQHIFIVVCSSWVATIPFLVWRVLHNRRA